MSSLHTALRALASVVALGVCLALAPHAHAVDIDFAATAQKYVAASAPTESAPVSPELLKLDQDDEARYLRWQRDYSRRGWEWHLLSTQLLFGVVLGIVGFGLWVTYRQFKRDYMDRAHRRPAASGTEAKPSTGEAVPPPAPPERPASSVKLGPAGLELTSQVVGLIVLAMSIAFFYFYVKEVYPMREIGREAAAPSASAAK